MKRVALAKEKGEENQPDLGIKLKAEGEGEGALRSGRQRETHERCTEISWDEVRTEVTAGLKK